MINHSEKLKFHQVFASVTVTLHFDLTVSRDEDERHGV